MFHSTRNKSANTDVFLKENVHLLSDNQSVCDIFNTYFTNITDSLDCPRPKPKDTLFSHEYFDLVSVLEIRKIFATPENFAFEPVSISEVANIIKPVTPVFKSKGYDPCLKENYRPMHYFHSCF